MQKSKSKCGQTRILSLAHVALTLFALILTACSPGFSGTSDSLSKKLGDSVGCSSFEENYWQALEENTGPLPSSSELRGALSARLGSGSARLQNLSNAQREELATHLANLYRLTSETALSALDHDGTPVSRLTALSQLEMGDRTTPEKAELQDRLQEEFAQIKSITASDTSACAEPTPKTAPPPAVSSDMLSYWQSSRHPAVYGALKELAVAYQSCDAGLKPALDNSVPDVVGITITGAWAGTPGLKRAITDLPALLRTDYYLQSYQKPSASCFDVTKNPPIYDYGGRPDTTKGTFDLFHNFGGTKVLGVDCSGYVFAAYAAAGLKMKKDTSLKASQVYGVSAAMMRKPQSNGLKCLDNATFTPSESLRPGDLLASSGHVVMIESLGADPFGIAGFTSDSQCITANMSISRFDFTILQSSPVKNGIGINRIQAADYFGDEPDMATALLQHAVNACHARMTGKSIVTTAQLASLVRHAGTPECMGTPIAFEHESCLSTCTVP